MRAAFALELAGLDSAGSISYLQNLSRDTGCVDNADSALWSAKINAVRLSLSWIYDMLDHKDLKREADFDNSFHEVCEQIRTALQDKNLKLAESRLEVAIMRLSEFQNNVLVGHRDGAKC